MRIAKLRNPFDVLCAATHFRNAAAEAARTAKTFVLIAKLRNQWNEDVVNVFFFDTGSILIAGPERVQPKLESRRGHKMLYFETYLF